MHIAVVFLSIYLFDEPHNGSANGYVLKVLHVPSQSCGHALPERGLLPSTTCGQGFSVGNVGSTNIHKMLRLVQMKAGYIYTSLHALMKLSM